MYGTHASQCSVVHAAQLLSTDYGARLLEQRIPSTVVLDIEWKSRDGREEKKPNPSAPHPFQCLCQQCLPLHHHRNPDCFFPSPPGGRVALSVSRFAMAASVFVFAAALWQLCHGVMSAPAPDQNQQPLLLHGTPPSIAPTTPEKTQAQAQARKLHGRFLHVTGEFHPIPTHPITTTLQDEGRRDPPQ